MASHASSWPPQEEVLTLRYLWTLITDSSRYIRGIPCHLRIVVAGSRSSPTRVRRTRSTMGWACVSFSQGNRSRACGELRHPASSPRSVQLDRYGSLHYIYLGRVSCGKRQYSWLLSVPAATGIDNVRSEFPL